MAETYNPDVLTCLANLSNDEVFTPPTVVNQMLDLLPQELFESPKTRFLDPAAKSGVFLREITKRLIKGLEKKIPDLHERVNHILHEQVFGIATTELTSLVSRRSLYCSKYPNCKYSISKFDTVEGNIRFRALRHTFVNGRCKWCGARESQFDRDESLESYAYEFIHTANPKEIFNMKFDVIIGNPPYQMADGGGNGASAVPLYHKFVLQARNLNPKYLIMITPSRWFTGGKGLDDYRDEMLRDNRIRIIHDFPETSDCFSDVEIKGGVSYFLWSRDERGKCFVFSHKGDVVNGPLARELLEPGCSTFIRYNDAIGILRKVQIQHERSIMDLVSCRMPFGLPNTYKGYRERQSKSDIGIYVSGNDRDIRGTIAYAKLSDVVKGHELIDCHKVFIGKAGSGSDSFPHPILPKPFYGKPGTICNESYLAIGPFESEAECSNVISYISTKFFRVLVLLKKDSQNAARGVYQFVPMQDFSKSWVDEELYKKYNLSESEIAFIESMIKPME